MSAFIGIGIISAIGMIKLNTQKTEVLPTNIRLIQPSLDQHLKWLPESFERNMDLQIALSSLEEERPLNAIIWPEAAIPKFLNESTELCDVLSSVVPKNGVLIVGTPIRENHRIFTTLSVLNEKAELIQIYKKTHLVPFGEYIPLKTRLPFTKLTHGTIDFSAGDGLKTLKVPSLPPFSPLICYEALFPGKVTDNTKEKKRPEWLLNITNDAWYGVSFGPYQHLALVRIRAIEEGLPLVRTANNGVSAVIDPCGRILHKLGLNDVGFVDFQLPKAISPTLYSKVKDLVFWGMLTLTLVATVIMRRRKNN
jgi:apolipoprotein N-acyltransferase